MQGLNLPYQPIRSGLYTPEELFAGYDPDQPETWQRTPDFAIYHQFIRQGGVRGADRYLGLTQALHDQSITRAVWDLAEGKRVAALMGGHRLERGSPAYWQAARLACRLTRAGLLVCTGGGPGAMEAAHLGAALAPAPEKELEQAVEHLTCCPGVPVIGELISPAGEVNREMAEAAHHWFRPAYEIAASLEESGQSLAVPTWHYGHEPSTPFATRIAKYFQNSIREAGLLAVAKQGIVFTEGKAGTIQEIFQDSNQNYYRTFEHFSPMVLLGVRYWTETYPVAAVLKNLFTPEDYRDYVLITDDLDRAAAFILDFQPG